MRKIAVFIGLFLLAFGILSMLAIPSAIGKDNDPEKETSTKGSLEITIDNADFSVTPTGIEKVKMKLIVKGTVQSADLT